MIYRRGVNYYGMHPRMRHVRKACDIVFRHHGHEPLCNSANDREHSEYSWHYYGCAIDVDLTESGPKTQRKAITPSVRRLIVDDLKDRLGRPYQVVEEAGHLHIEYDPVAFGEY